MQVPRMGVVAMVLCSSGSGAMVVYYRAADAGLERW